MLRLLRTQLVSAMRIVRASTSCLSSTEPSEGSQGELIGWDSSRRLWVRASVGVFTLSHMNISETSGQIAIKFCLKHHWCMGKAALGFE